MAVQSYGQETGEAFAGRMLNIYNDAALALMVAIGHETGLFDHMSQLPPSNSEEIAAKAGLNERYVREWLGAMSTGRIVEYDSTNRKFSLPEVRAAYLTRAAGTDNMATTTTLVPELGKVAPQVSEAFRHGGGVPYSEYERFQTLMRDESAQVFDATLIDVTLPLVPGLVERLREGIDVADVGCGAGHAVNLIARAFPNSRLNGYDFSEEGIALAQAEARSMGLGNAHFEVRDAARLGISQQFDLVTAFDAIHDQANPEAVLRSIYEALKPDGDFLCVDIAAATDLADNMEHPIGPFLYMISTLHCMTVSLALNGRGLGTVWGEQKAQAMMEDAGFRDINVHRVEGDILNNYYIAKKQASGKPA